MSETNLDSQVIERITESLANGNKIEAIKTYRAATGQGLKESREFIEQLIPGLVEKDPDRFAAVSDGGSGCAVVVLFLAVLGTAVLSGFRTYAG